jgi:hypothetical protein
MIAKSGAPLKAALALSNGEPPEHKSKTRANAREDKRAVF